MLRIQELSITLEALLLNQEGIIPPRFLGVTFIINRKFISTYESLNHLGEIAIIDFMRSTMLKRTLHSSVTFASHSVITELCLMFALSSK